LPKHTVPIVESLAIPVSYRKGQDYKQKKMKDEKRSQIFEPC